MNFDKMFQGFDRMFEGMGSIFNIFDPSPPKRYPFKMPKSSDTYTYSETYSAPQYVYKCPKCRQFSMTAKHVQVDRTRDCLLTICQNCGFENTHRTGDNPGKFDLPTVEEAKKAGH